MDFWLAVLALIFLIGSLMAIFIPAVKASRVGGISEFSAPRRSWVIFAVLLLIAVALVVSTLLN